MPTLDQLVSRVVERKGFAVVGADGGALLARKGEERLLVAWSPMGSVTLADASLFLAAMEQVGAAQGVLVAPKGIDANAKDLVAAKKGVEVWAESRLVVEVGEALVKLALDAAADPAAALPQPAAGPAAPPATVAAAQRPVIPGAGSSLMARAVASTGGSHNPGAAMFMPSKPTRQLDTGAQASIPQRGHVLGYAWGGAVAGSGAAHAPGIAQVRNGRRPRGAPAPAEATPTLGSAVASALESDDVEIITTPRRRAAPAAAAAPATPVIVPEDSDVEIITTPRRAPAPAPAPAAAAPATSLSATLAAAADEEEYEIITTKKEKPATAAAARAAPNDAASTGGALAVRLSREEAFAKAQAKGGATATLALVPHVAFSFDVHVERPGMPVPITGQGVAIVSSLTGQLRVVDALQYGTAPADARKDAVKLQAVDVYDRVKSHLGKTYGKSVNTEREVAGNTVMETIKVSPDIEEMGLDHKGIVYVPVWEATTSEGPVRVCALTGERL